MENFDETKILVTGGSGRLGTELKKLLRGALFPSSDEFDVTNPKAMEAYLHQHQPTLVIHAAAMTSPPLAEKDPADALKVNIIGTAQLVTLCARMGIKLVYISTDYVFKGDRGNYREDDALLPVNKYAWSKLAGECAVRMLENYLIVRTSFSEKVFPYEKAFTDHYTSRESVDIVAKKIVELLQAGASGVVHVGHVRRSAYEYAASLGMDKPVGEISIKDVPFPVPADTSLDTSRFDAIIRAQNSHGEN